MSLSRSHKRKRILLFVDGVSLALSYILMITLRFNWYFKKDWMIPLYSMLFIMEILFATLVTVYRGRRLDYKPIEDCDPLEVFVEVFKSQAILFVFLLIVLMVTKNTNRVSRIAMGILVITNFLFVLIFRMVYRGVLIKNGNPEIHRRKLAALVYSEDIESARVHLQNDLGLEFSLEGVHSLDEAYPKNGLRLSEDDEVARKRDELIKYVKDAGCTDAFICVPDKLDIAGFVRSDIVKRLGDVGINTYFGLSLDGQWITQNLLRGIGYYQATYFSAMAKRCRVLGIDFAVSNVENAVLYVRTHLKNFYGKYICFCNVHTTVEASEDSEYHLLLRCGQ